MVTRVNVSKPLVRQHILTKGMIEKRGEGSVRAYQNMSPVTYCLMLVIPSKVPKDSQKTATS